MHFQILKLYLETREVYLWQLRAMQLQFNVDMELPISSIIKLILHSVPVVYTYPYMLNGVHNQVIATTYYILTTKLDHFLFCSMLPSSTASCNSQVSYFRMQSMTALESPVSDKLQVMSLNKRLSMAKPSTCTSLIAFLTF